VFQIRKEQRPKKIINNVGEEVRRAGRKDRLMFLALKQLAGARRGAHAGQRSEVRGQLGTQQVTNAAPLPKAHTI
jgi:hypothetical protein